MGTHTHVPLALGLVLCLLASVHAQRACYDRERLVSDGVRVPAPVINTELRGPWGLAFGPTGGGIVANHVSSTLHRYDGAGRRVARYTTGTDHPTGISYNPTAGFLATFGGTRRAAEFVIATREGRLYGMRSDTGALTRVLTLTGSMLTGASIGTNGRLYLADFGGNRVTVLNGEWQRLALAAGAAAFRDPTVPADFRPFNVLFFNNQVIVAYARFDGDHLPAEAAGAGYVSLFDTGGRFVRRLATAGRLNAPWALAVAPATFGPFSGRLIIGNHGADGLISSVTLTGTQATTIQSLRIANGTPWAAVHLWGLAFGNGQLNQPTNSLYFNAAMQPEVNGVYGRTWNVACPP